MSAMVLTMFVYFIPVIPELVQLRAKHTFRQSGTETEGLRKKFFVHISSLLNVFPSLFRNFLSIPQLLVFFYHPSGKGVRIPNFIRASHNSFLNFWYPEFVLVCMYNQYVMDHYRIDEDPDLPLDIKYFLCNINIYSFTAELLPG